MPLDAPNPLSLTVEIDGRTAAFPAGTTILSAARSLGLDVPTLCHDERLKSCGACRMCVVEIDGAKPLAASCQTEVRNGMRVETASPKVEAARRLQLRMLARNYPREAFERFPEKPFHRLARKYDLTAADFAQDPRPEIQDRSHAYIDVDMTRCIDCWKCVRICDELQGQFVWQVTGRGKHSRVRWDRGASFAESSCVSCGACADACPTGAIEDRSVVRKGFPETWTKTVCPYCGTGCEMNVGVRADRIVQVKPALESPVNHGHLCVKGRYAHGFVDHPDRATEPMIRAKGGEWRVVSWDEAVAFASAEMKRIGADAMAVLGSARATNEENYVTQKFVRVGLATNNVDCCARVCHTPTAAAMKLMLGTGAATNSFADIEMAQTILICGANPTENHPIAGARIRQAVLKGAKLIVVDPRKTELARLADVHLQISPGTNILVFNAIANAIVGEGLFDPNFVETRVAEFDEYREFIRDYAPEKVAERCGVEAEDIRRAARIYATAKPAMSFHGLGMTEHSQGTEGVMCVVNLALLTGNIGIRGAGVNPLRGQNNVQGSAHMGCDPGVLTGGVGLDDGRPLIEKVWRAPVPYSKGLNQLQMMDAAFEGRLKGLWAIGYDVLMSNANQHRTEASMENLELVIVQDLFLNETAKRFGTVFFPAASSFEKDGTFMNAERRVSRVRRAVAPRGNSLSDWEIVCRVARAHGCGDHFRFGSAAEIWDEIRSVWPNAAGITYERLENGGLQWNCPDESHPGTEILHETSFTKDVRAALRRIEYRPTKERVSAEFPLLLSTGRTLFHFNAGTMTERTPNAEIRTGDRLEISSSDASRLGLSDGEDVILESAHGRAEIPVHVNDEIKQGELFCSFHDPQRRINNVTGPARDRFVQAPEFKVTAVRLTKKGSADVSSAEA